MYVCGFVGPWSNVDFVKQLIRYWQGKKEKKNTHNVDKSVFEIKTKTNISDAGKFCCLTHYPLQSFTK